MATCLTRIDRLPAVRNSGDSTEKTTTSSTSAMTARSRTEDGRQPSRGRRLGAASRTSSLGVVGRRRRRGGQQVGRRVVGRHVARRCGRAPSRATRRGGREHLGEVRAWRTRRPGPRRRGAGAHSRISHCAPTSTPRVGSSTSSTFGRLITPRAITTFCWLPPLSAVTGAIERRRLDPQPLDERLRRAGLGGRRQVAAGREAAERRERHVVAHREALDEARTPAGPRAPWRGPPRRAR